VHYYIAFFTTFTSYSQEQPYFDAKVVATLNWDDVVCWPMRHSFEYYPLSFECNARIMRMVGLDSYYSSLVNYWQYLLSTPYSKFVFSTINCDDA
jgi:hypothetical protein